MYKTKVRSSIIDFFKNNNDKRFTAREIYESLKCQFESINRTTIYRNLDKLCEEGELIRFKEPNQEAWFYQYSDGINGCNSHMHAQCSNCGKIFHLEDNFVNEFESKLHDVYGLDINTSQSIIVAKCEDCTKNK